MRFFLVAIAFCASLFAADVRLYPVCVHQLETLGAPVAPGGDFVQVFVTEIPAGRSVFVVLRYSVKGVVESQAKIVTANQIGAVAIFNVDHAARGFSASAN